MTALYDDLPDLPAVAIEPYTTWRHLKTNSTYTVLGIAACSTNGRELERAVVYISHTNQILHYRHLSEFMDGRFEAVPS